MIREIIKVKLSEKIRSVLDNISSITLGDIFNFYFLSFSEKKRELGEIIFGGDITTEDDFDGRDFLLSADRTKQLKDIKATTQYILDQGRAWRTRNACVVFAWYSSLCNSLQIVPSYEEVLEFLIYFEKTKDESGAKLWDESIGASIPKIHKFGCARWNEIHPDLKVTYYRVDYKSKELEEALSKGYIAAGGYNTFDLYSKDRADGFINNENYAGWKRTGGHSVCRINGDILRDRKVIEVYTKGKKIEHINTVHSNRNHIIDNYPTSRSSTNIYEHNLISEHCKNSIWYNWFYFIEAIDPKEVSDNVKTAENSVETKSLNLDLAIKEGLISDKDLDGFLTRREAGIIAGRLLNKLKK